MRSFGAALLIAALAASAGCANDYFYVAAAAPSPPHVAEAPPPRPPAPPKMVGAQLDITSEIEFDVGKSTINQTTASQDALSQVLSALQNNASLTKLRVEGHTDNTGSAAENRKLSEARAEAVVKWLVDSGVSPSRLSKMGCASRDPLAPNDSPAHRQKNRRTEFDIEEMNGKRPEGYTAACAPNPARKR